MDFMDKFHRSFPYLLAGVLFFGIASSSVSSLINDYKVSKEKEADSIDPELDNLTTSYYNYVGKIADKIISVNEERDILRDFAIYETMLEKGCFSLESFSDLDDNIEIPPIFGANVAVDRANSLHIAFNMADVFSALGYDAKVVVGKTYKKGEDKPIDDNHTVVYVSNDKNVFLLDPARNTVLLRHKNLLYYTIESQEDDVVCFEPNIDFENDYYGSLGCPEISLSFGNEFKKHWDVLKLYREYQSASKEYINMFCLFEISTLKPYEKEIREAFLKCEKGTGYTLN